VQDKSNDSNGYVYLIKIKCETLNFHSINVKNILKKNDIHKWMAQIQRSLCIQN